MNALRVMVNGYTIAVSQRFAAFNDARSVANYYPSFAIVRSTRRFKLVIVGVLSIDEPVIGLPLVFGTSVEAAYTAGRSDLVVSASDCGVKGPRFESNLTADGCVYHDSHCDI